jgi:hypothetical protein
MLFRKGADGSDMGMGRYQWCIFFLCGFGEYLSSPAPRYGADERLLPRSVLGTGIRAGSNPTIE